jgi:metal-responsive CopG/Arc/MetJ family transcriptional regulator
MNFNIYIEDELVENLEYIAQKQGKTRNALIREAVRNYISNQKSYKWSEIIMSFQGVDEGITFESYRDELLPPDDEGIF